MSSRQPTLFEPATIRSPLCARLTHCGSRAELVGEPAQLAGCSNQTVRCISCGATGVVSTNQEER